MNQPETPVTKDQLWEKMTLKQIVMVLIRLQAMWLFFNAAVYATYLPTYFQRLHNLTSDTPAYADAKFALSMEVLRIFIHIAAAILVIQYTESLLNYLLKDAVDDQKPSDQQ